MTIPLDIQAFAWTRRGVRSAPDLKQKIGKTCPQLLDLSTHMHPHLVSLPHVLLQSLGHAHPQEFWVKALEIQFRSNGGLYQYGCGNPYHVNAAPGLDLMLQCVMSDSPTSQLWGLHSFTLHAGRWSGGWPQGLEPSTAGVEDVVKLFAPDAETVMSRP